MEVKACPTCKQSKPVTEFYRDRLRKDGLYARCKKCHNQGAYPGQVRYKALNKERVRDWNKRWYRNTYTREAMDARIARLVEWNAAHPEYKALREQRRRARKNGTEPAFTREQWEALKAAYLYRCAYCGKPSKRLTMDHVVPLSKGGPHIVQNIVPSCRSCNSKKLDRPAPAHQSHLLFW